MIWIDPALCRLQWLIPTNLTFQFLRLPGVSRLIVAGDKQIVDERQHLQIMCSCSNIANRDIVGR